MPTPKELKETTLGEFLNSKWNREIVADFYTEQLRAMDYMPSQSEEPKPIAFFDDEE